ncbi:hypothetical protein BGX21_009734 [Mortierella sp. AD011]|nr:hypothetical protein BGX20_006790 [Mortierella sp. AD010]KAF9395920.1 hypothetical protein BGX21_009734 [Mortierella sp. AD011]
MSTTTTTVEDTKPEEPTKGPVGGHLTKKQRKEQFDALNTLQTQLDVSVSLARNQVSSWLNADAFSDDEDSSSNNSGFAAATVIQPRQPGLGLGAKFISHKDQMRHDPMNAFESKLKRQLTGGIVSAEIQRAEAAEKNALPDKYKEHKLMMAARRKELQEQAEDEEDSRTRNIGGGSNNTTNKKTTIASEPIASAKASLVSSSKPMSSPASPSQPKKNNQGAKYQAAVHPAALKALPEEKQLLESLTPASRPSTGPGKKRTGDFFSMYMDERANKMAKKKKKGQAKADPDDD